MFTKSAFASYSYKWEMQIIFLFTAGKLELFCIMGRYSGLAPDSENLWTLQKLSLGLLASTEAPGQLPCAF
jgi:hypothetical protein